MLCRSFRRYHCRLKQSSQHYQSVSSRRRLRDSLVRTIMAGNNEGIAATKNGNSNDGKQSDRIQSIGKSSNNKSNNSGTKQYHRGKPPNKTRNNHQRGKNHQTNQGGGNEAAATEGGGGASSSHKSNRNSNRTNALSSITVSDFIMMRVVTIIVRSQARQLKFLTPQLKF